MSKNTTLRKEYAEMLKERADKGFIEKTDVLDELISLMERDIKTGKCDLIHGSSGCGRCFYNNKPIIISKEYYYKNQNAILHNITKLSVATAFTATNCLVKVWQESLEKETL